MLAEHSGRPVTRNEVSRWEREIRLPTPYWQRHIALSFGVATSVVRRAVAVARSQRRGGSTDTPGASPNSRLGESATADINGPLTAEEIARLVSHAHHCYQATRYQELGTILPRLTAAARAFVEEASPSDHRNALRLLCSVEVVSAKLATKIGHGAAAWDAATRAREAAQLTDDRYAMAAATYQLVCAALKTGRSELAERLSDESLGTISDRSPQSLTWRGALTLVGAIIAARRNDRAATRDRLTHAENLADQLGSDGNISWTAFGPTNVRIHRMSAAVALEQPREILDVADRLDTVVIPDQLRGRQAQVRLDSAWANSALNEDAHAVINLLDAERVAPELVHHSSDANRLINDLLARERRVAMPGLRGLAQRAGVAR